MGTKVGIIYAAKSGIVRRVVVPDDDAELANHVGPGEAYFVCDRDKFQSLEAEYQKALGKLPPDPVCVVKDSKGAVVGYINADPELDSVPGKTIEVSPKAATADAAAEPVAVE